MTTQERMVDSVRILKEAGYNWDTRASLEMDARGGVRWTTASA
jgi:hypothetical protein